MLSLGDTSYKGTFNGYADASQEPEWFTTAPAKAIPKALAKSKLSAEDVDFYESNYASQRKIIIDRIKAGQDTTVEVKYTSGGGLVTTDEQNSVLDLQQINGDPDKVEFLFTDDKGKIIDTDKNVVDDFAAKTVTVGSGEKNIQAYKGGVFVKVRKADGTAFPLRVELAGNTEAQAFALARIFLLI